MNDEPTILSRADWLARQAGHRDRLAPHCSDRVARTFHHVKHPVRDFLFEYYSFTPARLLRWSPGPDVALADARRSEIDWSSRFVDAETGLILPARSFPRPGFLRWAGRYLQGIADRPGQFGCFGLHEWAMVYRTGAVRHATPLRLPPADIADIVESHELRCTHYDAFRFFTPAAAPRNRIALTRANTEEHDQPGCVHVTMDLYKYAYKLAPWIPAELVADAFELAWSARELDMRASPYDLAEFGMSPVRIETPDGKDEYARGQRNLQTRAEPIRARLLSLYRSLLAAVETADSPL
ncbi:MAG: 3-methyladenine DNA glycosylase [Gemmataceae bacterium]|nr:3-methyladenine DNA glycosylase [Gemmataceae bacterium]